MLVNDIREAKTLIFVNGSWTQVTRSVGVILGRYLLARASPFTACRKIFERGEPLMSLDCDQGEAPLEEGRASASHADQ